MYACNIPCFLHCKTLLTARSALDAVVFKGKCTLEYKSSLLKRKTYLYKATQK